MVRQKESKMVAKRVSYLDFLTMKVFAKEIETAVSLFDFPRCSSL